MTKLSLSIVITSYTEKRAAIILELLDSIKNQTLQDFEVIFVVDQSKILFDKIKSYLSEREDSFTRFKVIFNTGESGMSAGRNLGAKETSSDILAFLDDDVVLFPTWAEELVKTFQDSSIIGVTGPAVPLWETGCPNWFPTELEWIVGGTKWYTATELVDVRNAWGMNLSFRKQAFIDCGGFKNNFGLRNSERKGWKDPPSEDVDLSFRIRQKTGRRIVYNPLMEVKHRATRDKLTLALSCKKSA